MKYFLTKLLFFLLIPFVILLLLEFSIFLFRNDILSEKNMENIYEGIGNDYKWIENISGTKSLLLGSSSVRYGIGAKQLTEISKDGITYLNLAMDARDPIQTYFLLKEIDLSDVNTVYFGLDPWIFTKGYYKYRDPYLYLDIPLFNALEYNVEHDRKFFFKRYQGLFNYIIPFKFSRKNENFTIPLNYGSVKLERIPLNFNEPICEMFQIDIYGWSDLQFEYLIKIADLCKRNNIKMNVFLPPKRSDYSNTYKAECNVIHQDFKNKLEFLNFRESVFGKYDQLDSLGDKKLFAEAYHLNSDGQTVYTKWFLKMIKAKKESFSADYKWFNKY